MYGVQRLVKPNVDRAAQEISRVFLKLESQVLVPGYQNSDGIHDR